MDLSKILAADSPPSLRRKQGHATSVLRQAVLSSRRQEEVAEWMLELASSTNSSPHPPSPRYHYPTNSPPFTSIPHSHQHHHQIPIAFPATPMTTRDSKDEYSPQPKKGRRASTAATRRVVASPSGLPCPNCGKESSTLWRTCELNNGSHYLCNACGLRYKKGKFCPLCYRVYYDADTNQLHWQQCQTCSNWTHKACLIQQPQLVSSSGVYVCPTCLRDPRPPGGDHHMRPMSM